MTDIAPAAVEAVGSVIREQIKALTPALNRQPWESSGLSLGATEYDMGRAALSFIRDAIHRDGEDADAIRQALGLDVGWAVRFERDAGPTMDNPSGVITVEQPARSEEHALQAVKVGAPISARNRRPARRVVSEWQEVQP